MKSYKLFICVLFYTIYSQSSLIAMNYHDVLQDTQKNNSLTYINKNNITQSEQKVKNGHYILLLLDNIHNSTYSNYIMYYKNKIESNPIYMNINNIKNRIQHLRTEFKNNNSTLNNYYHLLLFMLHYALIQHYEDYIVTDFDKKDNNDQIKKVMNSMEQCKTIIRYLILLDSEYYICSNNRYILNLNTITQSKICDSITMTIYSIKEYTKFLISLSKIESNSVETILFRFNAILTDIIKNDMEKIKEFYCKYCLVLDDNIDSENNIDKEFDIKYDYYNWFDTNNTSKKPLYHDHKSLIELTNANNRKIQNNINNKEFSTNILKNQDSKNNNYLSIDQDKYNSIEKDNKISKKYLNKKTKRKHK